MCQRRLFGAWNAIPPARPDPLLSYLLKIVRNLSLKAYWRTEAAKRGGRYTVALEEIEGCIADRKTVEDEIGAKELARIIEGFLDTLTVENRVIFLRRYWYCDPTRAIARRCGVSEGKVRVTLHRTRQKLRVYLEERGVRV